MSFSYTREIEKIRKEIELFLEETDIKQVQLCGMLENLETELQDRLENMPENLQGGEAALPARWCKGPE